METNKNITTQQSAKGHEETRWLSSNWPLALGWLCVGLYSVLAARGYPTGAGQVGVAAAYAYDAILARKSPSKKRLSLVRWFAAIVFLGTTVAFLLPSAR
ncbi:MAG: hypothetical protein ABSH37_16185 [Bryobacteraceae bacterium]|jgi:hypothetical protein